MDIAKEIKKILIDKDMTLTDLAEKLGVTQQNVSAKLKKMIWEYQRLKKF